MSSSKNDSPLMMPAFTVAEKAEVLARVQAADPTMNTRKLAEATGLSRSYVAKLLKRVRDQAK